jgi:hypothetical protein
MSPVEPKTVFEILYDEILTGTRTIQEREMRGSNLATENRQLILQLRIVKNLSLQAV